VLHARWKMDTEASFIRNRQCSMREPWTLKLPPRGTDSATITRQRLQRIWDKFFVGALHSEDKSLLPPTLANFLCGSYAFLFLLSIISEDFEAHPRELYQLPRLENGKCLILIRLITMSL
jgi:hypothetical protein